MAEQDNKLQALEANVAAAEAALSNDPDNNDLRKNLFQATQALNSYKSEQSREVANKTNDEKQSGSEPQTEAPKAEQKQEQQSPKESTSQTKNPAPGNTEKTQEDDFKEKASTSGKITYKAATLAAKATDVKDTNDINPLKKIFSSAVSGAAMGAVSHLTGGSMLIRGGVIAFTSGRQALNETHKNLKEYKQELMAAEINGFMNEEGDKKQSKILFHAKHSTKAAWPSIKMAAKIGMMAGAASSAFGVVGGTAAALVATAAWTANDEVKKRHPNEKGFLPSKAYWKDFGKTFATNLASSGAGLIAGLGMGNALNPHEAQAATISDDGNNLHSTQHADASNTHPDSAIHNKAVDSHGNFSADIDNSLRPAHDTTEVAPQTVEPDPNIGKHVESGTQEVFKGKFEGMSVEEYAEAKEAFIDKAIGQCTDKNGNLNTQLFDKFMSSDTMGGIIDGKMTEGTDLSDLINKEFSVGSNHPTCEISPEVRAQAATAFDKMVGGHVESIDMKGELMHHYDSSADKIVTASEVRAAEAAKDAAQEQEIMDHLFKDLGLNNPEPPRPTLQDAIDAINRAEIAQAHTPAHHTPPQEHPAGGTQHPQTAQEKAIIVEKAIDVANRIESGNNGTPSDINGAIHTARELQVAQAQEHTPAPNHPQTQEQPAGDPQHPQTAQADANPEQQGTPPKDAQTEKPGNMEKIATKIAEATSKGIKDGIEHAQDVAKGQITSALGKLGIDISKIELGNGEQQAPQTEQQTPSDINDAINVARELQVAQADNNIVATPNQEASAGQQAQNTSQTIEKVASAIIDKAPSILEKFGVPKPEVLTRNAGIDKVLDIFKEGRA